jgi:hypothetical protein
VTERRSFAFVAKSKIFLRARKLHMQIANVDEIRAKRARRLKPVQDEARKYGSPLDFTVDGSLFR